jgi:hypothetical protein
MQIFLISPVALSTPNIGEYITQYISEQKRLGNEVYYPLRDTDQTVSELECCKQNLVAMRDSEEVHIFFSPYSEGSKFDLGMAFALGKKIKLINGLERTEHRSLGNMLLDVVKGE